VSSLVCSFLIYSDFLYKNPHLNIWRTPRNPSGFRSKKYCGGSPEQLKGAISRGRMLGDKKKSANEVATCRRPAFEKCERSKRNCVIEGEKGGRKELGT
jgi:hypothetical protein